MGKYINGIGTTFTEKCSNLMNRHNAKLTDNSFKENLVCVVDNGHFAAAAWAYSKEETRDFAFEDGRLKLWFIVPNVENLID